jgi:single-strand DNA-binding protein
MADGLNRVMLLGNLGAEPELRFTQGGQAVLNMRIATTESYLDKDRVRKERTDWHNVVVWGKRGEALAKILNKGSSVFVEGSLRTSSYDDRDGNKRYKTEVIATNILLTGGRGRSAPVEEGVPGAAYGGEYEGGGGGGGGSRAPSQNAYNRSNTGGGGSYGGRPSGGASRGAPPPPADPGPPPDDYGGYGGGGDDDIPF